MKYYILSLLFFSACFANESVISSNACNANILDFFYPRINNDCRLWINAEVLFWTPKEDSIVLTNSKTDLFTVNNVTLQPTLHTQFHWDFGSRISFGYLFDGPSETWDVALYWTYYSSYLKKKSDTRMEISEGMFPIWSLADDIIPYDWVSNAKMHWNLNLDVLDLDFGRSFSFQWFHIRLYTGLRSQWIEQTFNVRYGGGIFVNGPDLYALSNNAGFDQIHMKNNYWGIGPLLGIMPQFDLGRGWKIYASAAGSFTGGYFHLLQDEVYLTNTRFFKESYPLAGRWTLDTAAGISWATFLAAEKYALTFNLGWEYHLFFHQFMLQKDRFGLVPDNRDLSLTGGVFSARFDF